MTTQTMLFGSPEPPTVAMLRELGEAGKKRGMGLAADARAEAVAAGQVALLRSLIESANGTATIDDATDDLARRFERGGKWRGQIPSGLSRRRIIERIGDRKSNRPTRHRSYVSVWRLTDRDKANREIERLATWLSAAGNENPQSGATDAGSENSKTTNSTIDKEN